MKRMLSVLVAAVMMVSVLATSASAYAWTDSFTVYRTGGPVLTNAVIKLNFDNYFKMDLQPNNNDAQYWRQGSEILYARARDTGNNFASNLVKTTTAGIQTPTYYSGYGVFGYSYKLAAEYDEGNDREGAAITVNWEP